MVRYELPRLPHDYNELEPFIDTETMKIHHQKHHQTYVDGLNKSLEQIGGASHPQYITSVLSELKTIPDSEVGDAVLIKTKRGLIKGRGVNQQDYLKRILGHDINFGVGPAGTGKTYLAVACAVEALQTDKVRRIVLVRPAVEAGEKLGFLPGDLAQKQFVVQADAEPHP